jgi:ribosome biogenesis GTPase
LGGIEADEGLEQVFDDIQSLAENCRFSDCSHTTEKGCAVLEALQTGEVDWKRYQNFLRLTREIARNRMSYHEKRRRDKEFGKMCKGIIKGSLKNTG